MLTFILPSGKNNKDSQPPLVLLSVLGRFFLLFDGKKCEKISTAHRRTLLGEPFWASPSGQWHEVKEVFVAGEITPRLPLPGVSTPGLLRAAPFGLMPLPRSVGCILTAYVACAKKPCSSRAIGEEPKNFKENMSCRRSRVAIPRVRLYPAEAEIKAKSPRKGRHV